MTFKNVQMLVVWTGFLYELYSNTYIFSYLLFATIDNDRLKPAKDTSVFLRAFDPMCGRISETP